MTIIRTLVKSTTRFNTALPTDFLVLNTVLAFLSGVISVAAFSQLIRIHVREKFWTRQKVSSNWVYSPRGNTNSDSQGFLDDRVLHFLLGSSNLGYFIYFVSAHFATCRKWFCWSHLCGFVLMAYPKILFLAAFLLILSFWVDLCHQAKDEEEDDEGNSNQHALLEKSMNELNSPDANRQRGCCSFQGLNFRSRQKSAMVVVALLFIVMISFGVIILIGARKNSEDAFSVARVYEDIMSIASLVIGGALGCYGLLLYLKLKKIRSDIASSEMWKVSSLAVSSFICFTASSLVAILTDIPLHYHWHPKKHGAKPVIFMIMCYLLGSLAPSAVVLWITRELPAEITIRWKESRIITFIRRNS